ncbi:MAG TPA: hypothetical protein VEW28_09085 [Candidatus Kapabacteria bacterium]|nr:hypothetical protein [Candidatus Kapabacteria bacterium]
MKFLYKILCAAVFLTCFAPGAHAQDILDGLRLTSNPLGTGARSMAMGGAMTAAVNDYSALDFNPAALTLVESSEFSLSLYNKGYTSNAQFLGNASSGSISNPALYSFAYASNVPTVRGHLAFGISLDRVADFTSTYKFSAVNPNSSFLNTKDFVNDPGYPGGGFTNYVKSLANNNIAWAFYLTNDFKDTINPVLTTPFTGGLQQSGTVTQEGGLNAFRIGGGVDVAENISVGATVNIVFGSYDYRREYTEADVNHLFSHTDSVLGPRNFTSATIIDNRSQSITGIGLKLGFFSTPNDYLRFGLTVATPTYFSMDDHFSRDAVASFTTVAPFDSRDKSLYQNLTEVISNSYSITTPAVFGGGLSFNHWGLTLAVSADYSDYTQLRFTNSDVDLSDLNDFARNSLRSVFDYNFGAEYLIKPLGLLVRGGYSVRPSPFKGDPSEYDTKSWSTGIGLLLSKSAIIEASYRNTKFRTDHQLYYDLTAGANPTTVSAVVNQDDVKTDEIAISFSFRF